MALGRCRPGHTPVTGGRSTDYIVYDYLAEITMSIMARAQAQDETKGYALDFVSAAMKPNLTTIAERSIKVISNAGGVNPQACAEALRAVIAEQGTGAYCGLHNRRRLIAAAPELATSGIREMFSGEGFSRSGYTAKHQCLPGAFPSPGRWQRADIVVTGRCVTAP